MIMTTSKFFNSFLFAQVNKENLKFGHEAYDNGDFYSASYYFSKVIRSVFIYS